MPRPNWDMTGTATDLDGVALVTGAGNGIGKHTALTLAAKGVKTVFCADINKDAAQKTADEIVHHGHRATAIYLDVTNEDSVIQCFQHAAQQSLSGRIDYFVNAAGSGPEVSKSMDKMTLEMYRQMDEVHNIGSFLCLREALRVMMTQEPRCIPPKGRTQEDSHERNMSRGVIVMVTSLAAKGGGQAVCNYVAAKHAVEGLIQSAAMEYARSGIRVNGVAPTYIAGPMMESYMRERPGLRENLEKEHPMGRLVDPGEVSDTIVFLLSACSSYLNGLNMPIDGGVTNMLGTPRYR